MISIYLFIWVFLILCVPKYVLLLLLLLLSLRSIFCFVDFLTAGCQICLSGRERAILDAHRCAVVLLSIHQRIPHSSRVFKTRMMFYCVLCTAEHCSEHVLFGIFFRLFFIFCCFIALSTELMHQWLFLAASWSQMKIAFNFNLLVIVSRAAKDCFFWFLVFWFKKKNQNDPKFCFFWFFNFFQ